MNTPLEAVRPPAQDIAVSGLAVEVAPQAAPQGGPPSRHVKDIVSMGLPYALGTFNDNFFKQGVMLLALDAGQASLQGLGTILFSLPFVLFSAWAGWLADRITKRVVIIGSKFLELLAMLLALLALAYLSWAGMLAVIFLVSVQSTVFSPALNGSIPELFPPHEVPNINAIMKLATTCTILLGYALAGFMLDRKAPGFLSAWSSALPGQTLSPFGRSAVAFLAVGASILGFCTAFGIRSRPSACPKGSVQAKPFPLGGPLSSLRDVLQLRSRPALSVTLWGEAFFYFISSFALISINTFSKNQLSLSSSAASIPVTMLMLGVAIGAIFAAKFGVEGWKSLTLPACLSLSLGLALTALAPLLPHGLRMPWLMFTCTFSGIAGGVFLIPQVSFNQVFPGMDEKGKVLGLSNFISFSGILLAGLIFMLLTDKGIGFELVPSSLLLVASLFAVVFGCYQFRRILRLKPENLAEASRSLYGFFLKPLLGLRYKITLKGMQEIASPSLERPILFLPNHPAYMDPMVVYTCLSGVRPRPLADSAQIKGLFMRWASWATEAMTIPDLTKDGGKVREGVLLGLNEVIASLQKGRSVIFYPSGMLDHSHLSNLGNRSGVARILEAVPEARVVLVRTRGLWGSSFSCVKSGCNPHLGKTVRRAIFTLWANGLFFTPRRKLELEFWEPCALPRPNPLCPEQKFNRKALNSFIEDWFNLEASLGKEEPRFFWQRGKARELPDPE